MIKLFAGNSLPFSKITVSWQLNGKKVTLSLEGETSELTLENSKTLVSEWTSTNEWQGSVEERSSRQVWTKL